MIQSGLRHIRQKRDQWHWRFERLLSNTLLSRVDKVKVQVSQLNNNLLNIFKIYINEKQHKIHWLSAQLTALNPKAILNRGYSITRSLPDEIVIYSPDQVSINENIEVLLAQGTLLCQVERKSANGKKDI